MSTPPPPPTVEVQFKLHLEHMDLGFSVSDGKVQMAPGDFTQLLEVTKPKHAGLFGDTLKKVLELAGQPAGDAVAPTGSANQRMFDAYARVEEIRDSLNHALDSVTSELARLVAMPPIFDDEREPKTPPLVVTQPPATQPAPAGNPEIAPHAAPTTATLDAAPAALAAPGTPEAPNSATTEPAASRPPTNS